MSATKRVAIVGAGPSGLCALKSLREEGIRDVVVFEQSDDIGGQWNAGGAHSGVWDSLTVNTCSTETCFSDFPHLPTTAMYPHHSEILAYLRRYAERFSLLDHVRLGTRVTQITRTSDGWTVKSDGGAGEISESYTHLIVASGRFNKPHVPDNIKGLDTFSGSAGVTHSFDYRNNEPFRGKRMLVVGNGFSGLELASELAFEPDVEVISSCRKPRYIITFNSGTIPADWLFFNRAAAWGEQVMSAEEIDAAAREAIASIWGHPEHVGGLAPAGGFMETGFSACPYYVSFLTKGKIKAVREIVEIDGRKVVFADGYETEVDGIILATGYELSLPFLEPGLLDTLSADDKQLSLYGHTFHPDIPNCAFLGKYMLIGSYLPVLELQARWVAMQWAGALPEIPTDELRRGVDEHRASREVSADVQLMDLLFYLVDKIGAEPDLNKWSKYAHPLLFGPLVPSQFRLDGHGSSEEAEAMYRDAVSRFGDLYRDPVSSEQLDQLRDLASKLGPKHPANRILAELEAGAPAPG